MPSDWGGGAGGGEGGAGLAHAPPSCVSSPWQTSPVTSLPAGLLGSHCQPVPVSPVGLAVGGPWSTDRGSASVLAVTVALLPRMDGRLRPSHWAWSLLAVVLMAGGVASSGATVSGECGPSPRGAGVRGVGGPAHSARDTCDRWSGLSGASGRSRALQVQWGGAEGGASPQSEVLEWGAHTGRAVSPRTRAGLAPLGR